MKLLKNKLVIVVIALAVIALSGFLLHWENRPRDWTSKAEVTEVPGGPTVNTQAATVPGQ